MNAFIVISHNIIAHRVTVKLLLIVYEHYLYHTIQKKVHDHLISKKKWLISKQKWLSTLNNSEYFLLYYGFRVSNKSTIKLVLRLSSGRSAQL